MLFLKLAPVWVFFLLCFLHARVLARREQILADWRLSWIFAALAAGAFFILSAEIASAFHSLDRFTIATMWIGADTVLIWLAWRKFKSEMAEILSPGLEPGFLHGLIGKLGKWPGFDRPTRWIYGLGLAFVIVLGFLALEAPPFIWDCKSYHVPRILNWVQNESLRPFPTGDIRRVAYDPGAEISSTVLYLLDGSDRPINMVSWFSVVTSAILASFVTELLIKLLVEKTKKEWLPERIRLAGAFAFFLTLTIPEGLMQAISTENDSVAALWNLSLACAAILFLRQPSNLLYAGAIGLSVALGICTKASTFISATPFLAGVFGVLLWRRFYGPALKAAGILVVAMVVINGPWMTRNYSVFGRPLGPASVSTANVNPSFTPNRAVANIIRNLSLYTGTPSATVTKGLNAVVRALVFCTGRPLDDPTSVVPYEQHGEATYFYLAEPANIPRGQGWGNFHAWMIFAGLMICLKFPFRSALGFHAACLCAGFCLSATYLRWHPWLFRYHITYFVLAMPIAAIGLVAMARGAFIFFIGILCAANAGLMLSINPLYPIYLPFTGLSRADVSFGSNPALQPAFTALAEDIIDRNCTNVLLKCAPYNFDYGLWLCLQKQGYRGAITEFDIQNETARLNKPQMSSQTAVVFVGNHSSDSVTGISGASAQSLLKIEYYFEAITALFPSPNSGDWRRLLPPDNFTEILFNFSAGKQIHPDKPEKVRFTCQVVDRHGQLQTNNILRLAVGSSFGDFDLRSGSVSASALVTQSSLDIKALLLNPLPIGSYPAYLSKIQLSGN